MQKVYRCSARTPFSPSLDYGKKTSKYWYDEEFLLYQNSKGNWIATVPKKSTLKTDRVVVSQFWGTKRESMALSLLYVNIKEVTYVADKKNLNEVITEFQYEKGA